MKWKEWSRIAHNQHLWMNHYERGLLKAEYLKDYTLRLWFEEELDVSIYELDFSPLILEEEPGEALIPLKNKERFQMVSGDYALIWYSETGDYDDKVIDIAPECVRFFCEKYGTKIKSPQKQAA